MSTEVNYVVEPGGALCGRLRVPGDKSISHRAVMLGALARGTTEISGFLEGEDSLHTLAAFRAMGVAIEGPVKQAVSIEGVGLHGLRAPGAPLYLGNSGTSMRLLAGLLAGQTFDTQLCGDESLSRRPMGRVTKPLAQMGANIQTATLDRPPLGLQGGHTLRGIHYQMPVASAQVKSCLLLAGLYAQGTTCITEPAPTRDHTERMLEGFGYSIERGNARVCLQGGGMLIGRSIDIPADLSSAAFFLVGASIADGSNLLLEGVGVNPTRAGVIEILRLMGADIEILNQRVVASEPLADIRVRSAPLRGVPIPEALVPLAIDEFPIIFVAAASAAERLCLPGPLNCGSRKAIVFK